MAVGGAGMREAARLAAAKVRWGAAAAGLAGGGGWWQGAAAAGLAGRRSGWCVASLWRRECAWRRYGGAPVCIVSRRFALAAGVRAVSLSSCSCRCSGASRRFSGGCARGAAVVVHVSVFWRLGPLWWCSSPSRVAWRRSGGGVARGAAVVVLVLVH